MKQPRVALIGAGQFGSRHLQALALCKHGLELFLVDPLKESRAIARERFESIEGAERHQIQYLPNLDVIPNSLDVAIVATPATYRRQVIESLLMNCAVDHLVLEKVLFQSADDCCEIKDFLTDYPTKVWVNATRRMWEFFIGLKSILEGQTVRQISFSTAGWGLACNTFHMLDLFTWLTDSSLESLSSELLDQDPIPARRDGFYELTGMLVGRLASGACFTITDHRGGQLPLKLTIETEDCCFVVQEGKAEVTVLDGDTLEFSKLLGLKEQFQSQLTNELVESLMDDGTCALPSYDEASAIHEIMLPALAEVFNKSGYGEHGVCPIT